MQGFNLKPNQLSELKSAHRCETVKRRADKIKAIILLGTGWTQSQVSEILLLDEDTLRKYVLRYKSGGLESLLKAIYFGKMQILSSEEKSWLKSHVAANLYTRASDIAWSLYKETKKKLSIRTITRNLNQLGFSYKKTKLVPGKADHNEQNKFINFYNKLKADKSKEDCIYFVDSMHPTHNVESGYAWIKTGADKEVLSNSGRQRISINGAIDIENMHAVSTRTDITNGKTMIELFTKIDLQCRKKGTIHIILDNARYNYSRELIEYVSKSRIKLHYLPSYSPNLNPIERLWKFMKGEVIKNKYYKTFDEFKIAIQKFFQYLKKYHHRLRSLLTDNFKVINASTA